MEEITKPNDIFAAVLQAPDLNVFDLAKSRMTLENTQLQSRDFYKTNDVVKEAFMGEDGNFNELAFNNAYNKAAQTYAELGNDEQLAQALEWDPQDFTAPLDGKHFDIRPSITKDVNPFKNYYSRTGVNSLDTNDFSLRELAQKGKVYDPISKTWSDKSANELSFFSKFFGDTLVYAQYDKDEVEIDATTGQQVSHKKGDWKFDEDGNLFIEKLAGREMYGKQIVNPMDMLTVDGSAFNKVDFFDSDGKTKSITGTSAKLLVEIAPFLIPGVQTYYGAYKMSMGLAFVLPTFYKAIEGIFLGDNMSAGNETELWKAMNSSQGFLAKYNQRSVSDKSQGSLFNYEQLGGIVSDIYSQIYEQRAAASLSKFFYKNKEAEYLKKLGENAQEQFKGLTYADQITGVQRTKADYDKIARAAGSKIQELNDVNKKRSQLAKNLNLSYMAMTQSAQVYGDALNGGYDRRTAGAAALMSAAGQFALMSNNPLGDWFLDSTTGYNKESIGMIKTYNKLITTEENLKKIQEGITTLASNKKAGKNLIGETFQNIKKKFTGFINSANTGPEVIKDIKRNAVIEGIEEVSEQAVMDMSKGVVDFLSYVGLTGKQGSFGGFDVVFSKSGLENYLANFVGGIVGGAMFETERSIISPLISGNGVSKDIQYTVEDYIANGKAKEFLEVAKKQSKEFASNSLSPVGTDVNGEQVYLGSTDGYTQADFLYKNIEAYVTNIERILNSEMINSDNESWVRKAIVDEIKIQDMKTNNTDSFVLSDIRELVDKIVTLKSAVETAEKKNEDPTEQQSALLEAKNQLDEIQSGEKADYYYGLSLFSLNKSLHAPFLSLNVDDYAKSRYKLDFSNLSKAEQDRISAEFTTIMNEDAQFKNRMKTAFDQFMIQNENFSQSLMEYGINGYDAVRKASFDALYSQRDVIANAVATKDIESLKKVWTNLQTINARLLDKDINNAELNSSIGINFGKFLLDSGIVGVGLSEKEMSDVLGINPADLDVNLQAQAILNRWEKENNPLLQESLATLQEVINDTEDNSILPAEKKVLQDSLLTTYADNLEVQVAELYKPEVFLKQDYNALDDNAKLDLADTINAMVPTMDTIEADILELITDNINLANRKGIAEFSNLLATTPSTDTDTIEKHTQSLQQITDRKTLRVDTEKKVLNKPAFINQNLNKFYEPVLEFISTLSEALGDDTTKETIQAQRDANISDKETAAQLLSAMEIDNANFSWNDTKGIIEDMLFNEQTLGKTAYSELLEDVKTKMEAFETTVSANLNAETESENIDELVQENLSFDIFKGILFDTLANDRKFLALNNFNDGTNTELNESGLLMNNILGKYSVYQDPYDSVRDNYFTPTAQLIVDFGNNVMVSGRKLDNEVVEAAKIELSKLNYNASGPQQTHVENLTEDLNKIIEYGNVQRNTLLDKLREVQIQLYGDSKISKSAFDLLRELNQQFAQSPAPAAFKINSDTRELIDKAMNTINMVKAVMSAMTFTNTATDPDAIISYETLYGYNVNFNKMYKTNNIAKELGILGSADVIALEKELELLEVKLLHFQLLADNNMGSVIKEQGRIKTALLSSLQKRLSEGTDDLSLIKLAYKGRSLITIDDLADAAKFDQEGSVAYLENKARENFLEIVNEGNDITEVLDKLFEPFLNEKHKINTKYNLLDNKDSLLTETMSELGVKDWYMYLHSILAGSSIDFLNLYKKYLAKEVSLSENFRAPFYSQQFIMRQAFGYLNGVVGKKIMAHSVSFIQPKIDNDITTKDVNQFNTEFVEAIKNAAGIPISWLYFIRGTGGTGKSDILANFLIWASTEKDVQLLGNKLDISALAPTEKTKLVLENSVKRGIEPGLIKTNTIEAFIETLFPTDSRFSERINAVKSSTIESGEVQFSDPTTQGGMDTGIYIADNTAVFSQKTLDLLFKNVNSETPKLVVIDEASKINSLQYQLLNYLAEYKNYFIIILGDDLQEGTTIGPATSSMENIYMPSSIKLKSTIRGENIHKNDNNIALEDFANSVRMNEVYQNRVTPNPVILSHSLKDDRLNGDRFIDKLTIEELKLLDPEEEILFITDDGEISSDVKTMIIAAFGEKWLAKVKSSTPDVQGQEFKQVVVLTSLEDSNQPDDQVLTLASAKKLYTLLTRAKVATLVVGASKKVLSGLKFEVKPFTAPKVLDTTEVKSFLDTRDKEIEDLLESLNGKVKNVSTWESIGESQTPVVEPEDEFTNIANDTEILDLVQTEKQDFDEIEQLTTKAHTPEVLLEEKKTKEESKETTEAIVQTSKKASLDVKVISYSYYYNLGKDLPDMESADAITKWVDTTSDTQTDFAAYVYSIKDEFKNLEPDLLVKFFKKHLNYYLVRRNELLAKITIAAESQNNNGRIKLDSLSSGVSRVLDLSKEAYIKKAMSGEYSQPYGVTVGAEVQSGVQFFVMIDLDGIPITLAALASQVTATSDKNKLGDINKLKAIYAKLYANPFAKIPINLVGNVERLTGVKTIVDPQKQTKISGDRASLENAFKGATVREYGAFRGPKYNEFGEIDINSENTFIAELESTLNTYNKTPIKIANRNAWETWQDRPKGVEAYQKYMYRPYVILSYYKEGVSYDKLMLLYPTSRSPQEYWDQLKTLDSSTKDVKEKAIERDSLISRYQAWKILEDFIKAEVGNNGTAAYQDVVEWLGEAFLLVAYQRSQSGNMQTVTSKVKSELNKWNGSQSFTEFVAQNKTLQKIFRGVDKSFNPLTALYAYLRTTAQPNSLDQKFENYIKTSDFKVYYSTRLESLGLSTAHGATHAAFDTKNSSRYFVGYSIQPPDFLINLDGIYEESTNVKPVELKTPTKPKTQTKTEEAPKPTEKVILNPTFSIAASTQDIGLFKANSSIIKVDLSRFPKIMAVLNNSELSIENRTEQLNNLKNFVNVLVRTELVKTHGFLVGELLEEDAENDFTVKLISDQILTNIEAVLKAKNTSSGTNLIAITQTEPETSICKIN